MPDIPAVESKPLPPPVNLSEIVARNTKGRVIMYSLDDPAVPASSASLQDGAMEVAPLRAVPPPGQIMNDGGVTVPNDPNVRIFPVR